MELKKECKQTEIGVIPKDWDVKKVGEVCRIYGRIGFRGYTKKDIVNDTKGAIALSPSNIQNGEIQYKNLTYISWFKYEESPEIKIYNEDILLVKTGSTFGKSCFVKNLKQKATLNPQLVVLKNIKVNNQLLSYIFKDKIVKNQILKTIVGGAIPTLSQKQVENYLLPLPPTIEEQKQIANVLSDTDQLIQNLEILVDKKKSIKQGAMQKLLTGKKRLKGFTEKWETRKLGDISDVKGGGTPSTFVSQYWNGNIDWFTPTEIGNNKYVSCSKRKITEEGLNNSSATILPVGTILLTTRAGIGDLGILTKEACTNQGFQSLVVNRNNDTEFIYYLLMISKNELESKASGSTFQEISPNNLKSIELKIPKNLLEQQTIAQILSDMDAEIEVLEKQLQKTQALKRGMMQELLTGKIRLVKSAGQEKEKPMAMVAEPKETYKR